MRLFWHKRAFDQISVRAIRRAKEAAEGQEGKEGQEAQLMEDPTPIASKSPQSMTMPETPFFVSACDLVHIPELRNIPQTIIRIPI